MVVVCCVVLETDSDASVVETWFDVVVVVNVETVVVIGL